MNMQITVEIKTRYGTEFIYPKCDLAEKLTRLTGKKTLSQQDIDTIKSLGYSVNVYQEKATL